MRRWVAGCALALAGTAQAAEKPAPTVEQAAKPSAATTAAPDKGVLFQPEEVASDGEVAVGGSRIAYRALAGTIVVHPKGWDDAAWREKSEADLGDKKGAAAEASMFYTAYFRKGVGADRRPITFLFNGGPGSASLWLHLGAFGPVRVVTADDGGHTPAAPYRLVPNASSLLDVSDLVFVDAPGTGFSRIAGKDKEKGFYGVDADAHAFSEFVKGFLARYGRWNSPKYLFGESYGTPRAAAMAARLGIGEGIDLNGVMLLSATLAFDLWADTPQFNPGIDEPYLITLPTFAATAWFHNRLPGTRPPALEPFLAEVQRFVAGDYAAALAQGADLDPARKAAVADQLARYTGLPAAYILKSNLRVNVGQFTRNLQDATGQTVGRLDTRFAGPSLDPLSREAEYDPQSSAISSAYVSAFNDYARTRLHYGEGRTFKPSVSVEKEWDLRHEPPGAPYPLGQGANLLPDLAAAMKFNPRLQVMVLGGYYDLATPYAEGLYELRHLPVPAELRGNLSTHYYPSGHMVYAHEASLKALHDDVAAFIRRTDNLP